MEKEQAGESKDLINLEAEDQRQEESVAVMDKEVATPRPRLWAPKFRHFKGRVINEADVASSNSGVTFGLLRGMCLPKEVALVPQFTWRLRRA